MGWRVRTSYREWLTPGRVRPPRRRRRSARRRTRRSARRATRPTPRAREEGFRPDIEGLRGIAVTLVVLFHAGLLSAASVQLTGGFIGVDLFFVVSGYLITGLLIRERERNGRISFSRFYARRVRRIMPAAAVTLLICLPFANSLVTLVDRSSVMQDAASAALSIANIRFQLTTDYFNPVNYSPFLHFWSLGVEEQFYFVWPALMAVAAWKAPRIGSGLALGLIVVVSLAASIVVSNDNATNAFYMLPTRAWQLASGGLLAVWTGSLDSLPRALRSLFGALLSVAGLGGPGGPARGRVPASTRRPRSTPAPPPSGRRSRECVLLASGPRPFGPGLILRLPPVRFIGKISYSLYLWHWPILILGGLWLAGPMGTLTPAQALALALVAVPVSWVSWFLVEEPFRRGRIPLPRPSRVVAIGVAMMLVVAMVGEMLDFGAQAALAAIDGPDATPTAEVTADDHARPRPRTRPSRRSPRARPPTPVPEMTPALTYAAGPDHLELRGRQPQAGARQGRHGLRAAVEGQLPRLASDHRSEHLEQVRLRQPERRLHGGPHRRLARLGAVPGRERGRQGPRLEADPVPEDQLPVPGPPGPGLARPAGAALPAVHDVEPGRAQAGQGDPAGPGDHLASAAGSGP